MSIGSILRRLGAWLLVAGVVCLTLVALLADFGKVKALLFSITPSWLAAIVVAVLFNYFLRFAKWEFFLRCLGVRIPWKVSLWVFFSAFTMVLSPGKLGEVMKSLLLKNRFSIPVARTAPVILAERITDLLGLLILAAIGSSRFAYGSRTLAVVGTLLGGGILLMTRPWFWVWLDRAVLTRIPRLSRLRGSFKLLEESTQHLLTLPALAVTVPLSAVSWAGEGVALFFIFRSMGLELPELLGISIFAHAFSSIVGAVSFLPGGLLVTEGTLGVFFVCVGISKDLSGAATLLIRAVTLWFAVVLGTVIFLLGHRPEDLRIGTGPMPAVTPSPAAVPY